jgi:hypothetical protein
MRGKSSARRHRERTGRDPVDAIRAELAAACGGSARQREVSWPLHLRVGKVAGDAGLGEEAWPLDHGMVRGLLPLDFPTIAPGFGYVLAPQASGRRYARAERLIG